MAYFILLSASVQWTNITLFTGPSMFVFHCSSKTGSVSGAVGTCKASARRLMGRVRIPVWSAAYFTFCYSLTKHWIDYLPFYIPLKNFSLTWRRPHCRWRAAKFRPMLGAQGLWTGRDLYRATPAVTRDLCPLSREGSLSCHNYCDTGPQPFEQGGIFIVPQLLWHAGPQFSRFHPKDLIPHFVASYDTRGDVEDLF
jgi:hypothetical protein